MNANRPIAGASRPREGLAHKVELVGRVPDIAAPALEGEISSNLALGTSWIAPPISEQVISPGQALEGASSVAVTVKVSKLAVLMAPLLWEVTANPAVSGEGNVKAWVEPGTAVQVEPSGEV